MFTWQEILAMGLRERGFWLRQAEALRRQNIALIAHAVGLGMAGDRAERERAVDALELNATEAESRKQRSEATWGLMRLFRGGKGV